MDKDSYLVYTEPEVKPQPKYENVETLHKQMKETYEKLCALFSKDASGDIHLWVDFGEKQPEGKLTGYFVMDSVIYHCFSVTFDYVMLFPANKGIAKLERKGVEYSEILRFIQSGKGVLFTLCEGGEELNGAYHITAETGQQQMFSDDIGKVKCCFPNVKDACVTGVSKAFREKEYTLVDNNNKTSFTASRCSCVLFAQQDNEQDANAIQVLRWFPKTRSECIGNKANTITHYDMFFEMGYISSDENKNLHEYMIQRGVRFLFGEKEGSIVRILGGMQIFLNEDYYFPKCLVGVIAPNFETEGTKWDIEQVQRINNKPYGTVWRDNSFSDCFLKRPTY